MTDVKRMDVHEALDEVQARNERLEEEIRTKTDLCNNLKRSQDEIVTKFHEVKLQSDMQAQELSIKSEELSTLSKLHQDLKSSFQEKESSVKHLSSAIEKVRLEYGEKVQKLEDENKELFLALDEATTTSHSLKSKVDSSNTEIEDLKRILSLKDKKLAEISDTSRASKDVLQRDEVISTLEEKHRDVQDQLKWKNEQFQHLEEAHLRLQDNFKSSKVEWEKEKALLLEEICSVQTSLDSQIRISENLQSQLRICNQALAHEESNRKLLEVEISEYKSRFEDISSEFHEAKATIEKLTHKRDEEVAELRDALVTKDSVFKEMGYKMAHLEQDNKDLMTSLKEFQEAQISKCGDTGTLKKLQKKFHGLEQVHKKCGQTLKEKEVEWKSESEKVRREMDEYISKLEVQSEEVKRLQEEVESSHSLSEVYNEEMSSLVLVLKSELSVALSKLESRNNENEVKMLHLTEQLENKNNVLREVNLNLAAKCEEVASLMKRVESFDDMKQHQLHVEEQIRILETSRKQEDTDGSDALSQNMQLARSLEVYKIENQVLVSKANEQNEKIVDLQQQLVLLETMVTEKTKTIEAQNQDKEKYFKVMEDKESSIKKRLVVSEQEKERLLLVIEDRNQNIEELEKEVTDAVTISEEKQIEIDVKNDRLHKLERMLVESSKNQILLEEQIRILESIHQDDTDGLNALSQKFAELEKGKLLVESENMQLATSLEACKTENQILVSKANEQNKRIVDLQQQLVLLESLVTERTETIEAQNQDKEKYFKIMEDKESSIKKRLVVSEQEKERLLLVIEDRNQNIEELVKEVTDAVTISEEKQIEIDVKNDHLHKLERMLAESSKNQILLEGQIRILESIHQDDTDGLNALSQKFAELEKGKLFVESENMQLATSLEACKTENQILVSKANEQNKRIVDLQQQLVLLESLVTERTETIEAQNQDKEKYFKVMEDKESSIKKRLVVSEQEKERLLLVIEDRNQNIEELVKEVTDAVTISEEKQIEIDVKNDHLHKLERMLAESSKNQILLEGQIRILESIHQDDTDGLNALSQKFAELEKGKLLVESENMQLATSLEACKTENQILVSKANEQNKRIVDLQQQLVLLESLVTERTETIEAHIQDKEKYSKVIEDKENIIKNLLVASEQGKTSLLQVIEDRNQKIKQLVKEANDALMISEEKQSEIDVKHEALCKLNKEVCNLHEEIKVKDESLLHSSQHVEELEALLQINKLDTEQLKEQFKDEKTCLEKLVKNLEVQNQALHEDIEKLEALLKTNNLDAEHLKEQFEDEKTCLENQVKNVEVHNQALHEDIEKLEALLKTNKLDVEHLKEQFEDKKTCLENQVKNLEVHNQSLHEDIEKQEALLCSNKLDTEHLKEQFEDKKTCLQNLVKNLEVENRALHEDVEKLLLQREDLLTEMEITSEHMNEYCQDVELMGMLKNMLQNSDAKEGVVNLTVSPLLKGKGEIVDGRLPLVNLNK